MAVVIGFSGKRGSGKSTISRQVSEALDWPRAGFGDYVRAEANRRGLDHKIETLQAVGESLIHTGPETFCRVVLLEAGWEPNISLIIDGIRHVEVVTALRKIIAPVDFRLVHITVEEPMRESRLIRRDSVNGESIRRYDRHSTEAQVATALPELADLVLDGSDEESGIVGKIVRWAGRISSQH